MPTELLPRLAAPDPELTTPTVLPPPRSMVLPPMPVPPLEKLPLRLLVSTGLPPQKNTEPPPMLDLDQALVTLLSRPPPSTAPLLTTLMALLPRPLALALARSPPTPTRPLPLTRRRGDVVARAGLVLPGEARPCAGDVPRRTSLPRRARAAAATRPRGRDASSRGRTSSRGGLQPPRDSSRGVDVD